MRTAKDDLADRSRSVSRNQRPEDARSAKGLNLPLAGTKVFGHLLDGNGRCEIRAEGFHRMDRKGQHATFGVAGTNRDKVEFLENPGHPASRNPQRLRKALDRVPAPLGDDLVEQTLTRFTAECSRIFSLMIVRIGPGSIRLDRWSNHSNSWP